MSNEEILASYLIFDLKDGRKMAGKLDAIDQKGNCVLKDVIVELPEHQISPINDFLEYKFDGSKDFKSKLQYFYNDTEGKSLDQLAKRCFCINGIILNKDGITKVSRVIKS